MRRCRREEGNPYLTRQVVIQTLGCRPGCQEDVVTPRRTDQPQTRHGPGGRIRAMPRRALPTVGAVALVVALGTASCQGTSPPASLGPDDITNVQRADRIINS